MTLESGAIHEPTVDEIDLELRTYMRSFFTPLLSVVAITLALVATRYAFAMA